MHHYTQQDSTVVVDFSEILSGSKTISVEDNSTHCTVFGCYGSRYLFVLFQVPSITVALGGVIPSFSPSPSPSSISFPECVCDDGSTALRSKRGTSRQDSELITESSNFNTGGLWDDVPGY